MIKNLKTLINKNYFLFIVSNQPDYVLERTTKEELLTIEADFKAFMLKNNIHFKGIYYCHHHPNGAIPELAVTCKCRKPSPFFIEKAVEKYDIDVSNAWMVGDCGLDVMTGKNAGIKTILQMNEHSLKNMGEIKPDFMTESLDETVERILS
ncbi:MAG: HAD-IIIA family hydrolase [Nitrospinae bacterium]|nr:HAD-IIIA family hydrolase [Nitrospinota bacterium]